ncbi:MAG: glycosyltransferase family 39 protein [Candidatus Limnocylindrales bacterium]
MTFTEPVPATNSELGSRDGRFRVSLAWVRAIPHGPRLTLAIILVAALTVRAIWLTFPAGTLIFDEAYYVNAARTLLGWVVPAGANYAGAPLGLDPNTEHPPLGKILIAGSMLVFGDNGIGWRLPSLIAGMIALVALYRIVRGGGESQWLGVLAVGLFAFDNLALVHSRIGTLDMLVLAPMLVGAWAGIRGRWGTAGALMGLATLVKLTALYGLLALLLAQAVMLAGALRERRRIALVELRQTVLILAGYLLVSGGGLTVLDSAFTSYTNPIDHVGHMLDYGAGLTKQGGPPTSCVSNDSAPWQWLVNDCQINYLRVAVDVKAGDKLISSNATVDFRGALNPVLLGAMWLAVPFAGWLAWRKRNRLAGWSLLWMAANYLPYIPLALLGNRVTYLYYMLPVVPALGVAVALLLMRSGLPRFVTWSYVAAYVVGFAALFPFRQLI